MKTPETQQKILNSAKRWFLEKGFKSAPLRKIAVSYTHLDVYKRQGVYNEAV